MTNYITRDEAKAWIGRDANRSGDPADDAMIDIAIAAACAAINNGCNRNFSVAGASSARLYVPNRTDLQPIHDCTSVTAITVDGTTIDPTVWQAEPVGLDWTGEDSPYTSVRSLYGYWWQTIPGKASMSVTATWGWAATPAVIPQATRFAVKDIIANRDVSFGIAAFTDYAGIRARENPQITQLIATYRRGESWGIA